MIPGRPAGELPPSPGRLAREGIAVIVVGRNQSGYLAECLASIRGQWDAPARVVYVDDASGDDSLAVAARFGVEAIALPDRVGMCAARMRGVAATDDPLLLFVDSDNTLPPDYLRRMREDLGESDLAYPAKRHFGSHHHDWDPPPPDRLDLWRANHVDTCSLMRRDAFLAAGGWRETPVDTRFDWHLALRMTRRGAYRRSSARLNYRLHAANWSHRPELPPVPAINAAVRRDAATVTVATVWSGRLGRFFFERWIGLVAASLRLAGKESFELLIANDSTDELPVASLPGCRRVAVEDVRQGGMDTSRRRPDRAATAGFLAMVFGDLVRQSTGDVIWLVEDDVTPPLAAAAGMLDAMMSPREPIWAVGAGYRSRQSPDRYVAAQVEAHRPRFLLPGEGDQFVDLTGTGCLMLLADAIRQEEIPFRSEWRSDRLSSPAHDWAFTGALRERGHPVYWMPSIGCRHWINADEWV